jgi:ATP-dependent Clp protease protease subunit
VKKFWEFKAQSEEKAELLLYGEIASSSWWGDEVTPKEFNKDLEALGDVSEIKVFINSNGGDVFAGQAIYSMLKRHKAQVIAYVDGLAASIASVIAMAADIVVMPKNSMLMIHNPWTMGVGEAADFRKLADDLEKIRESIIVTYQAKSGLDREEVIRLMDAETWLSAEEALQMGFADQLEEEKLIAASAKGKFFKINGREFDLSKFKNPPKLVVIKEPQAKQVETLSSDEENLLSLYRLQINKNRG